MTDDRAENSPIHRFVAARLEAERASAEMNDANNRFHEARRREEALALAANQALPRDGSLAIVLVAGAHYAVGINEQAAHRIQIDRVGSFLDADRSPTAPGGSGTPPRDPSRSRYVAHFQPQVWLNDQALDCDAPGESEWDCTKFLEDVAFAPSIARVDAEIDEEGVFFDRGDQLMHDPTKPAWIADWTGPFAITVRREDRWNKE